MSFLSLLRGKQAPTETRLKMITEQGNNFYSWNGKLYESDIIRSCIRPYSKAVGKLSAKHMQGAGASLKEGTSKAIQRLLEEPNSIMSGQMLLEKLAIQLKLNNNAFALINRDINGLPIEIIPIVCTAAEMERTYDNGDLIIKFTFDNGHIARYYYADIIHLRQDVTDNGVFGASPAKALTGLMEVANTTDQGVIKAIKNGAIIKWLLKFESVLRPEELKQKTEDFAKSFMDINTSAGVAGIDNKMSATQVAPTDYVPNDTHSIIIRERIYSFFNTNEYIVQSNYTEDIWNAYYESEIEPVAIQLSNEFTRKLFSERERGFKNRIIFEANNLQYASMNTKLSLLQMVDRGALSINDWRKVMNLPPLEDGDVFVRRLDTAQIGLQESPEEEEEDEY